MDQKLIIDLNTLPEFGQQISGVISPEIFELETSDGVAKTGLVYDFYVQRFDTELLLRGKISTEFEFMCCRTLHPFTKTIELSDYSHSIEITEEHVDATEILREDILILVPIYPVCEMADEPMTCKIEEKYLALDKENESDVENQPAGKQDDRWSALDDLGGLKS